MNYKRDTSIALVMFLSLSAAVVAQSVQMEGFIKARNGEIVVLQTADTPKVEVLLTDSTRVGQVQGVLKARKKDMSMAALIPGLAIKVEGTYNDKNQLLAKSISFKGDDLKRAQAIQAGVHETQAQAQENKQGIAVNKEAIAANQAKIAANKAAIDAAVARFGQLDDYYILDEVTIYFGSGKTKVEPKYNTPLLALTEKAKTVDGYMIEVKGYASSSGSVAVNQQLSQDRASNVTNILIQQGKVPLTRMLAPGAMGESEQIAGDQAKDAESANRRVVVRILQNKAVAGIGS
jgi:outer membrane protein OmpA-like peptidoglycan-associated protein